MAFIGRAKRLDDIDISRIAARIGCDEDHLHAFMDVEASGSGFDAKSRPKMLFEPHIFYRLLKGNAREMAVREGVAYPKWSRSYPKDSYPRLERAMRINETAALKSASWGLGQILGLNHAPAGYDTVHEMVSSFLDDEEHHLEAIVNFLVSQGIDDDLRAERWAVVARVYNGPSYAEHQYHTRMAERFAWWRKRPNTPYPAEPASC